MGETKIEWCDFSHNFWVECESSPGERRRTTPANWRQPYKWHKAARQLWGPGLWPALAIPRPRVFTNSLSDFFDAKVPEQWRYDAWNVISETPLLDWLILTKRPQNIRKMLPNWETKPWGDGWPNVWIGCTAENQEEADRRLPHLIKVPAVVRFISAEPLLGPIDLTQCGAVTIDTPGMEPAGCISWTIIGGESGPHARPMNPDWARSLLAQCREAGVAAFMKQMGGKRKPFPPIPEDLLIREWPQGAN